MSEDPKLSTKYVMIESGPQSDEDEIDLLELIRTLLQGWKTIVGITILCTVLAVAYALYLPDVFKAETILAPAQEDESGARSLLDKFGGLVAIAGVQEKDTSFMIRVFGTLNSSQFIRTFITKFNLLPSLFYDQWDKSNDTWLLKGKSEIPTLDDGRKLFQSMLSIDEDPKTGLTSISFEWQQPNLATNWVNNLVKELNQALRQRAIDDSNKKVGFLEKELANTTLEDMRKVLYSLLESEKQKAMLANVNEDYAFEVIDPATVSKVPEKPKRKLIVALGGLCGGFLGIFSVFFAQFLRKLKSTNI
jgi:LPS O-antigen subunit length determinant protein (WzzB/FepE family)